MTDFRENRPTGPVPAGRFSHALRTAIRASGLSLSRIQYRLRERGLAVSSATLSYWQSGQRRPTRQDSVQVVQTLEDLLRVPTGSLTGLLEPPGTRRRGGPHGPVRVEALWDDPRTAAVVRAHLRSGWDAGLVRISAHDRCEIGPDRRIRRIWHRQVLRAEQDGPDRWLLVCREESPEDPLPEVRALWRCRVGTVLVERQPRLLVAELLLDRALARGETFVMEYELRYAGPGALARERYERKFQFPVHEHVIEAIFDPAAIPARCEQYHIPPGPDGRARLRPLSIDDSGYAHVVLTDVPPGRQGIRWDWSG
ncbi:MAG: hypothetical protein AUG44_05735 [Actinobacteria bacterium 13_1_20CM_3_71_11]|nr:MAG: hypothetical protein AUG44_05735 [Actinobacteria bacterium 13_1_20CM_3_71_11]